MESTYTVNDYNARRWVRRGDSLLGAVSTNGIRTYVYPFNTPSGVCVIQESPPDHPHQQGIMVSQDFVNGHNVWAMGALGFPKSFQQEQSRHETTDELGATVSSVLHWCTEDHQRLLMEERTIRFSQLDGHNVVDVTSTWHAIFGPVHVGVTKEGGVGMRVHSFLETHFGGKIRSSEGVEGANAIFDQMVDWIEVSGTIENRPVGIVMMPHPSQEKVPWFTRDYGLHLFSPRRHTPLTIAAGQSATTRVGFAAYDGVSDGSQGARAWSLYSNTP